jgi:N-acetylmuramoyl-L-alanine amidase
VAVPQDETHRRISRRKALQLGAGAGAAALAAPYVARLPRASRAFDVRNAQLAFAQNPNWPAPAIITRAQWGANEALRRSGRSYDSSIAKIVVHHTGTPNSITDYAGLCRGIMADETAGEYIDIAYNWLIDPFGRIYEGRWAQDYAGGATHTGEHDGAQVRGAHALYHNTRTIGIALMGTYDAIDPPAAMLNSLINLLAWKCARWGIDPLGHGAYSASNGAVEDLYNICGHRDTYATACPGARTEGMLPAIRQRVAARLVGGGGYWIASSDGQVLAFGGVPANGGATGRTIAAIAGHPSGSGYWLSSPDGAVYSFGDSRYHGGMNLSRLNAPIVGMAATTSGNGYWLVGGDGGIFSFGDAHFYGSTGAMRLNAPVLGMLPTSTGKGYWLYARDGGVFSFGDAKFHGSTGAMKLNQPVTSMSARPQGDGYWLVAADGGVFSFGKAPFEGSGANEGSHSSCIAMLPSTTGKGYVILRRDGSVSAFGDAPNLGGATGLIPNAVGIAGKLTPL